MKYFYNSLLIICLLAVESVLGQEISGGVLECSISGYDRCVQLAIEAGDDINIRDRDGGTPIVHAVREGHESIVRRLLDAGTDIKAHGGPSLLFTNSNAFSCNPEITSMLLSAGEDVNAINKGSEQTPLYIAVIKAHTYYESPETTEEELSICIEVVKTLLGAGAKVDRLSKNVRQYMIELGDLN